MISLLHHGSDVKDAEDVEDDEYPSLDELLSNGELTQAEYDQMCGVAQALAQCGAPPAHQGDEQPQQASSGGTGKLTNEQVSGFRPNDRRELEEWGRISPMNSWRDRQQLELIRRESSGDPHLSPTRQQMRVDARPQRLPRTKPTRHSRAQSNQDHYAEPGRTKLEISGPN